MTVIAFRDNCIAADGRVTEDNTVFTDKLQKIFRLKNGGLLGTAGDADDRVVVELINKLKGKLPTHKQLLALQMEIACILVNPDGKVYILETEKIEKEDRWSAAIFEMKEPFIAIGTGAPWAMGAMARGATAKQAVEVAKRFDNNCGGEVAVLKLVE